MATLDKDIKILMLKGEKGDLCEVSIGDVTTGDAGSDASVTKTGTSGEAILNFTIPRGDKGDKGDTGPMGTLENGGIVPIANGGTNATTATNALSNLGAVPTTRTINSKALSSDVTLSASDVGAVPTTRTINSKALSSNITLSASDVGAVPTTRTVNSKALSSNITLSASDVGAPTYENGTWSPSMGFWDTSYDGTYTVSDAYYFKIGGMVYIQCRIKFTSTASTSHQISLVGLPFKSTGFSVGSFNLNSDSGMQGTDYKSGTSRIGKNTYITFDNLAASDIANNRYLTVSATYKVG